MAVCCSANPRGSPLSRSTSPLQWHNDIIHSSFHSAIQVGRTTHASPHMTFFYHLFASLNPAADYSRALCLLLPCCLERRQGNNIRRTEEFHDARMHPFACPFEWRGLNGDVDGSIKSRSRHYRWAFGASDIELAMESSHRLFPLSILFCLSAATV